VGRWGISSQHRLRRKWGAFFCNMLGVNVAKSSLHLHFLKTLEFRTDVSVISMAGVAEAIRLATSHPPSSMGMEDLRHKATTCPNPSTHPIPFQGWSLQNDLWAANRRSTCLSSGKGQISLNSPKPGSKCTTCREGCLALCQPGSLGLRWRC
jgi:hypothetical protein